MEIPLITNISLLLPILMQDQFHSTVKIMLSLLEKIVEDVVDMEFVIHLMDNAHVILIGKDLLVINMQLQNVQMIVEEMEFVKQIAPANVILNLH